MNKSQPSTLYIALAFFAIYVVWGSTYLFVAYAVEEVPPLIMASVRFVIASVLIFIFSPLLIKWNQISKKQFLNALWGGFLFLGLGNGAMTYALQFIDSGFSSLIVSAQPLVLLIMMWLWDRTPIKPLSMIGVGLGIIGMYLLVSQKELVQHEDQWKGLIAIISCLFTWGYASMFVSKADMPKSHFVNAGIQMSFAAVVLFISSYLFQERSTDWMEVSKLTWASILYLSIFGSIIAFTAFNFLLEHISPEKVSTSTYINPIIALGLGWYFRDELITTQSLIAAAILLTGVYFINTSKTKIRLKKKGR